MVELEAVTIVPRSAPHAVGLAGLRSRVLTVIDGRAALGLGRADTPAMPQAIVVPSDGHAYALLVDAVEDVVEAIASVVPLRAPIGTGWDGVAAGLVEADGDLLILVDPHRLIAGPAASAAAA